MPYTVSGLDDGSTVSVFTVPDKTKVTITYDALVIRDSNPSQTYTNEVSVKGEKKTSSDTVNIDIEGAGRNQITVPNGRKVAILAKSGWTFGKALKGIVVSFH